MRSTCRSVFVLLLLAGAAIAQSTIVVGRTGPRRLGGGTAAKCQAGTASIAFSFGTSWAPSAVCESDGVQAYIFVDAHQINLIYDRLDLPADWTRTANLTISAYTSAVQVITMVMFTACVSSGNSTVGLSYLNQAGVLVFQDAQDKTKVLSTPLSLPGCSPGDMLYWELYVNASTSFGGARILSVNITE